MTKERRLGRGLAALLGSPLTEPTREMTTDLRLNEISSDEGFPPALETKSVPASDGDQLLQLNVYEIDNNPFQPRREFSAPEIAALCESLKSHDMLQPVLVRRVNGRYQLISGERRLRAAIAAGWSSVPARVRDVDDRLAAELAIVENLQREDLNAIEKALSFRRYLDQHGCTQDDLANRLKIDRSSIANLVRLLELPSRVQDAISAKQISAGHARAMLPLGDEREQIALCDRIRNEGLSVRQVEQCVAEALAGEETTPGAPIVRRRRTKNEQVASLEEELRLALGSRVEIRLSGKGRGKVVVHFRSHEDWERLHAILVDGYRQRRVG